jgi:hypothetical protein
LPVGRKGRVIALDHRPIHQDVLVAAVGVHDADLIVHLIQRASGDVETVPVAAPVGREVGNTRVGLGEDRLQASPARKRINTTRIQALGYGRGGIMWLFYPLVGDGERNIKLLIAIRAHIGAPLL